MANLISVSPYSDNVGGSGECAKWDREPSLEQAAQYMSNEWAVGSCAEVGNWRESNKGGGDPKNVWWGIATIFCILLLLGALALGAWLTATILTHT